MKNNGHPIRQIRPGGTDFLTTADVKRELGIGHDTLYRWIKTGVLPEPIKLGRRIYWCSADLYQHMTNRPTFSQAKAESVGVWGHRIK